MSTYQIGLDVGGSHVSGALVNVTDSITSGLNLLHKSFDSKANTLDIVETISSFITEVANGIEEDITVGIAMPGPFNYQQGISEIQGVGGKFRSTFGLHMTEALKTFITLPANNEIYFANDAHCFAVGAYYYFKPTNKNVICLTLGTGLGSGFIQNGKLVEQNENIPVSGAFYCEPFKDSIADDYFSTRWLLNTYRSLTGNIISSVKELARLAEHDEAARNIFSTFGENLAVFLYPWLKKFDCNIILLGGNISKAWKLFSESFNAVLSNYQYKAEVLICDDTEEQVIKGVALLAKERDGNETASMNKFLRKTSQPLLPVYKANNTDKEYDIFPSFHLPGELIKARFASLAKKIASHKTIIIDGFGGVLWDNFRTQLNASLVSEGVKPLWYDVTSCLKPEVEIDEMISKNLNGNDPVFGKRYLGDLADFFDQEKLQLLQPDTTADICILYGTGAALAEWDGLLVYLDVPKNEIQYRARAGSVQNLGTTQVADNSQTYKRFYFVDWPVLNKHKYALHNSIDIIVDEQRITEITWMNGDDFRNGLNQMFQQAFRARPWFEAGVWGGQWMKKKLKGIEQDEVNYGWSFELITPENGIVFEAGNILFEVSFDFLLSHDSQALLGKAAERFGMEFPIRFDFLDTFDGGNLSVQCHPRTGYIKEKFGENFTQDETYYILDCTDDAKVYLGFQDNIEPATFKSVLSQAQENGVEINADDYVQSFPAHKHDLFLIPSGTIHASGKNNLVLEISSTPYIFTFKMYDWQRLDLTEKPRPINIEHAFNNLYFHRKGKYVEENLISKPQLLESSSSHERFLLSTHPEHFYAVERYVFKGTIQIQTNQQCMICMLVEGDAIEVTTNNTHHHFNYAETFIIPASINGFDVRNLSDQRAILVLSYVKDEYCPVQ